MRHLGLALVEAAAQGRAANGGDRRQAARRAAAEVASEALGAISAETAAHSDDVDVISEGICRRLGLPEEQRDGVLMAARLHDIGKIAMPPQILQKPGPLEAHEWALIREHTALGQEILHSVPELAAASRLVRHSHERWDGAGYPDGLAGDEIPLGSRIIFCADAFHAIRSDRPYQRAANAEVALTEIRSCAGTQFDPIVVEALSEMAGDFRRAATGSRSSRASRLMALLLIVGVGATASALARSGIFPTPDASATTPPAAAGPLGAPPTPPGLLGISGGAEGQLAGAGFLTGNLVTVPLAAYGLHGPGTSDSAIVGGGPFEGTIPPGHEDEPGVRDHGQGIGRGKGQGKGRGNTRGRGHHEVQGGNSGWGHQNAISHGSSNPSANAALGKANAHSTTGGPPTSSGNPGKPSGGGPAPKAPKPPKTTPPAPVPAPAPGPSNGTGVAGTNSKADGNGK